MTPDRGDELHPRQEFSRALRSARITAGLTQKALGDDVGVSQNTISSWEAGELPAQPELVFALERALGMSPGWLSRLLGYLPLPDGDGDRFIDAIRDNPHLGESTKRVLAAFYHELLGNEPEPS